MKIDARNLIRMQVQLEYQVVQHDRLVPIPGSGEQARYIIYRHEHGYERFFAHDLPQALTQRLIESSGDLAFADPPAIAAILELKVPSDGIPVFRSGIVPQVPKLRPGVQATFQNGCWTILVGVKPVAWAWSIRQNESSAELAVEVDPEFRRQGFGYQAAAAWANQVLSAGLTAFYSYKANNLPSMRLANSLGVEMFAECLPFD